MINKICIKYIYIYIFFLKIFPFFFFIINMYQIKCSNRSGSDINFNMKLKDELKFY